jgi:hypothetical protein
VPGLHEGRQQAAAVAAHVPGLLGFHPEMSIVVVGASSSGHPVPTLRYDLPGLSPQAAAETADHAAGVLQASGADAAVVICYGPAEAMGAAAEFRERLARAGLRLAGIVRCEDGSRCWCLCGQPSCDAAPVPVLPPGPGNPPGRPVLADRAALAATLAPVAGPAADAVAREIRRARARAAGLTAGELFERGCAAVSGAISAYRAGAGQHSPGPRAGSRSPLFDGAAAAAGHRLRRAAVDGAAADEPGGRRGRLRAASSPASGRPFPAGTLRAARRASRAGGTGKTVTESRPRRRPGPEPARSVSRRPGRGPAARAGQLRAWRGLTTRTAASSW